MTPRPKLRAGDIVRVSVFSGSELAGQKGIVTQVGQSFTANVYFSDAVDDRVFPQTLLVVVNRETTIN